MNNTFEFVNRSILNNSRSKQAHQFGRASRFQAARPPTCSQSAYNLTSTLSFNFPKKESSLSRDYRFKTSATITPSPNQYKPRSFVEQTTSLERGHAFGKAPKLVDRSKKYLYPGPGTHELIYNPEKTLSYTMRAKVNKPDHRPKVGPGQYYVESYQAFDRPKQVSSKFNNSKFAVLGNAPRFSDKQFKTIGPGPITGSRIKTQTIQQPKYSFGRVVKGPSYIRKNTVPGPGSYNKFSQFSELKFGMNRSYNVQSMSHI